MATIDIKEIKGRLNQPRSWEVPTELYNKPQPENLMGNIIRIVNILNNSDKYIEKVGIVAGWVKTSRDQNKFVFIELTDGSSVQGLQIVIDKSMPNFEQVKKLTTHSSVKVQGKFVKSIGKG